MIRTTSKIALLFKKSQQSLPDIAQQVAGRSLSELPDTYYEVEGLKDALDSNDLPRVKSLVIEELNQEAGPMKNELFSKLQKVYNLPADIVSEIESEVFPESELSPEEEAEFEKVMQEFESQIDEFLEARITDKITKQAIISRLSKKLR